MKCRVRYTYMRAKKNTPKYYFRINEVNFSKLDESIFIDFDILPDNCTSLVATPGYLPPLFLYVCG